MRKKIESLGCKVPILGLAVLAALVMPTVALAEYSDAHGAWSREPEGPVFIDAQTRELISSGSAAPSRAGYDFGGYWSTPYDESDSARQYFDENLGMVGEPKWHELSSGAKPLYAHWKYRIYLSTNSMSSSGDAVMPSQAGAIDATDLPADTLRIDDGGTPDDPNDDRIYLEVVDGAPLRLPRVVGRAGYLDSGAGTDGLMQVNARAWGVRPGAYGWATGIIPLDADGITAGDPRGLELYTSNIAMTRPHDGIPYFKSRDVESIVFPAPHPATRSITLYMNWENRAKTYDVKLTSAYAGFTVSNAPTRTIKAVYDMPLLMEKSGSPVVAADESMRFFAPEKMAGEGSKRAHEYLFTGFRTQPNELDGMQGEELIDAKYERKGTDVKVAGLPMSAPFRLDAEAPELFAAWGRPKSTLTLDLNGGSLVGVIGGVVPVVEGAHAFTLEPGAPTPSLPGPYGRVPARPGYAFKGYYTKATGAGAPFAHFAEDGTNEAYYIPGSGASVSRAVPADLDWNFYTHTTLYAHWEYSIDFRLDHARDCVDVGTNETPNMVHATMTLMSGPMAKNAVDRYGNRYPLGRAVRGVTESRVMAEALSGARMACEESHMFATVLAGVPVKMPVAQGNAGHDRAQTWQVRDRDDAAGEVIATARGDCRNSCFTSATVDGGSVVAAPFLGVEPHAKTKTITAFVAWNH